MNLYAYAGNNPISYDDPFGLWPGEVHDMLIKHALKAIGVSDARITAIQKASRAFDASLSSQSAGNAYMHAMKSPGQSNEDAIKATNAFIQGKTAEAKADLAAGNEKGYINAMAQAMHAEMDETSPWHRDANGNPIQWNGVLSGLHGDSHTQHKGESGARPSPGEVQASDQMLRQTYQEASSP